MTQYFFRTDQRNQAEILVKKYHYSHRIPTNVQLCITWHLPGGLFGDFGECIASIFYSIPPTIWSEPVWELSRLVRKDNITIPLTKLISESVKLIKRQNKIDLLVSFADPTVGHHGGIYQASSWQFARKNNIASDGLIIDGKFIPNRTCSSIYGTRSPDKLKTIGIIAERHFDEGKYLYWKALSRSGEEKAARLGLQKMPYPKPDKYDLKAEITITRMTNEDC